MAETDILLIYPPWDQKFYQAPGLPILAAHIIVKQHTVRILDTVALGYNFNQTLEEISRIKPSIIGVSVPFTPLIKNAIILLKLCREHFQDALLLAGGYHCTIRPSDIVDHCDLVVLGEGGETANEIIEKFKSNRNIYDIDGTAYKNGAKIVFTPQRIKPEKLLMPAWHLCPLEKHRLNMYLTTKERAFPLQTGKGCPFRCTFCCNSKNYEKVPYRDIEDVIKEIRSVIEDFNVRAFHIWDETFTLKRERVVDFCSRVINGKLDIRWSCQTRVGLIDPEVTKLAKKAGCVRMSLGIESGDPKVLRSIQKDIDLDSVEKQVKVIKEAGIVLYTGFMVGHAEDAVDSVARTIEFMDKIDPDFIGFRIAIPYPGCAFRDVAEKKGKILTNDFSKYRDDTVVYIPPGLEGYDLKKIRDLGDSYFYCQKADRISKLLKLGFANVQERQLCYSDVICSESKKGGVLDIRELIERYCKDESQIYP